MLASHSATAGQNLSRGQRRGLMLGLVFSAIGLFVLPLPSWLLDPLLLVSLALSGSLLVAAVRAGEPARLPQLPSLIFVSVLLRLGLNIAGLRAVLSHHEDASFLVSQGSALLFSGDLLVGALVMVGFATVEYLVLARGGERVAEVAARFVLDALPGRQAAIEADLRGGTLTGEGAQRRRAALDREAQIYGALDGVLRLLRGDVVASLLLLSAGVVFGVLLGVLRQGLDVSEAVERYVSLVLSQALLTQLPVLLNVAAAGLILTRAGDDPRPHDRRAEPRDATAGPGDEAVSGGADLWLEQGSALHIDAAQLDELRQEFVQRVGFAAPPIQLRAGQTQDSSPRNVTLWLRGTRLASWQAVSEGDARRQILHALLAAAPELLTLDTVQAHLTELQAQAPALLRETLPKRIELGRLTAVLRLLLRQRVWPLDLRALLEVLATLPKPEADVAGLAEQLRGQLGRVLLKGYLRPGLSDAPMTPLAAGGALGDGLPALLISTDIEALLRESGRPDRSGQLAVEPELARDIVGGVLSAKQMAPDSVLLCHADVRREFEALLSGTPELLPVFAYSEVPAQVRVIVMGRVEPGGESATPVVDSSAVPWQMRTRS